MCFQAFFLHEKPSVNRATKTAPLAYRTTDQEEQERRTHDQVKNRKSYVETNGPH